MKKFEVHHDHACLESSPMNHLPTFVKMAPAIIHTPGLFISPAKRSLARPMMLRHTMGNVMFTFSGPQLGPVELRVLQGLAGFAALRRPSLARTGEDKLADDVQKLLRHTAAVCTTKNDLAEVIGYSRESGSAQTAISKALRKLAAVSVSIRRANSFDALDLSAGHLICDVLDSRHIEVEFSPILAAAVYGGPGTYLRLDLLEARQLNSDPTRLLHQRLHWVNSGSNRDVSLDKMIGYVWSEEVSASAHRTRRQVLKQSLNELTRVGWSVMRHGELYQIGRPRMLS